jgi:hypothetical protein
MKQLFGVANNSPHYVQDCIARYGRENESKLRVQILGLADKPSKKADVILVPTVSTFSKNLAALHARDAIVFLFDSPVMLGYVKPMEILDSKKGGLSYKFVFTPLTYERVKDALDVGLSATKHVKVSRSAIDVIPNMLNAQLTSILNPIQDCLYSIRDTDRRLEYQRIIYTWLVSGSSSKALEKQIAKLSTDKKGRNSPDIERMLTTLKEEGFANSRAGIVEAYQHKAVETPKGKKGKPLNYKKLCAKYNIDPFDIRYTLSLIRKFGSYQRVNQDINTIFKETVAKAKDKKAKELADE